MTKERNTVSARAVESLPRSRVAVLGRRAHGTSEVIAALRSLDRRAGLEDAPPRHVYAARPEAFVATMLADAGPKQGRVLHQTLATRKRNFSLYDCVDDAMSVLLANEPRFEGALWVHSADRDVEPEPIATMLNAARFLGARRVIVFVTDAEMMSASVLDQIEQDARELLCHTGFDGDASLVVPSSGAIKRDAGDDWKTAIRLLREALEEHVEYAELEPSFAMPIATTRRSKRNELLVSGTIVTGRVCVGDELEVVSRWNARQPVTAKAITREAAMASAQRGDEITVSLGVGPTISADTEHFLVSPRGGCFAKRVRTRAFNWCSRRTPTHFKETPQDNTWRRIWRQTFSIDPAAGDSTAYEMTFSLLGRQVVFIGQSLVLADSSGPIGTAFIDEVVE